MPLPRFRAVVLISLVSLMAVAAAPRALGQDDRLPTPDAQRAEKLMSEVARLQSEVAKLKQKIAQLEKENAELKAALPAGTTPGGKGPGSTTPGGKPGTPASGDDFAATPDDPLGAPEAALAAYVKDYAEKVTESAVTTPAERQKTLADVGAWVRSAKKHRGRVEWIIAVKEAEPDPLKGGGTLKFSVVNPVDKKPYSDVLVTQTLNPGQWRGVADKTDVKHWKLTGQYSTEARFNKELEDAASTPMFIGLFAEMHTTLNVQNLTPAN
ncbi:MAG: hypothetical protein ACKVZJ_04360 [Phycisphaerales bacterium]